MGQEFKVIGKIKASWRKEIKRDREREGEGQEGRERRGGEGSKRRRREEWRSGGKGKEEERDFNTTTHQENAKQNPGEAPLQLVELLKRTKVFSNAPVLLVGGQR